MFFILIAQINQSLASPPSYVSACDEVCSRSDAEKSECCRAHGRAGSLNCVNVNGRMIMACSSASGK
uniref:Uncharacterized protein n=1 Tax=Panagrolaimus sp. PS1159 TaxID=55785 RepID=A0AC35F9U0_9BILA